MSVAELIDATKAASVAAETPQAAPPTAAEPIAEVSKPAGEQPVQEKPASDEKVLEPEIDQEPDLETAPESSGDFEKFKSVQVVGEDGKPISLFKAFPDLRAILGREKAFSEFAPSFQEAREIMQRIPSLDDAQTLVSDAESKRALSQTFREDVPTFTESLKDSDPVAFEHFVKQFPEVLAQTDETLWVEQAKTYTARVLGNAFILASNSGNAELIAATELVARSLGIPVGQSVAAPAQNTETAKLRKQLQDRDNADAEAEFNGFWGETDGAIIGNATAEIESTIKSKLPNITPKQLELMKKEIYSQTLANLNAQPQFMAQIEQYRDSARKGRRGIAEHKQIVDFGTRRAKLVIPKVAGAVISEWTKDVLRMSTETTQKKQDIAKSTKDVGAGPQGTTSSAAAPPPATGKPRGVNSILSELGSGNYVKR